MTRAQENLLPGSRVSRQIGGSDPSFGLVSIERRTLHTNTTTHATMMSDLTILGEEEKVNVKVS